MWREGVVLEGVLGGVSWVSTASWQQGRRSCQRNSRLLNFSGEFKTHLAGVGWVLVGAIFQRRSKGLRIGPGAINSTDIRLSTASTGRLCISGVQWRMLRSSWVR